MTFTPETIVASLLTDLAGRDPCRSELLRTLDDIAVGRISTWEMSYTAHSIQLHASGATMAHHVDEHS